MTQQKLSAERARELFSYDPETGVIVRKVATTNSLKVGDVAGSPQSNGYLRVRVGCKLLHAHRLAWLIYTGEWPLQTIDHINGIRSDNRLSNLRDVSKAVNNQNKRAACSSSGYAGVFKSGARFASKVTIQRAQKYLGTYDTPAEAHQAYVTAKRQLHVGCTI